MSDFDEFDRVRHRRLTVAGRRLHVAVAGEGPPVVLLHGWPEFWAAWLPLMRRLAGRFRLIAPDLYGFGQSDMPAGARTDVDADFHADDIAAVIETFADRPPVVVGHDVGAFVGQSLARRHPAAARAFFFFDCPTPAVGRRWIEDGQLNEIWYQSFHQTELAEALVGRDAETCRLYLGHFLSHWSHRKDAFDAALDLWVETYMRPGALAGGFNWYRSYNARRLKAIAGDAAPDAPKIPHKTRIWWGRHDPICRSEWARLLDRTFADFTVGFAEDAGHFPHVETPDAAAAELARFIDSLP